MALTCLSVQPNYAHFGRVRLRSEFCLLALLLMALYSIAGAFQVEVKSDKAKMKVGETASFTVHVMPSAGEMPPPILRARILYGPEWAPGGQSIAYEEQAGARIKVWQFDLLALAEGPARVTPVVYPDSAARGVMGLPDSVLGSPIVMQIVPAPPPSRLPRLVEILSVAAILVTAALKIFRVYRKRQADRRRTLPDPLTEALSLLDDIRVHCREDRTVKYLSELNRVLQGYLSRRLGRAMPTATPTELTAAVSPHLSDAAPLEALDQLLRRCVAAKYSGARTRIEDLQATEALASVTLERLDRAWVRESPPTAST